MKSETKTILAIAPGKQLFGVAVFDGIELTYFAIRSLKNRKSGKLLKVEIAELIQELITRFTPSTIAIKAISQYQKISLAIEPITKIIRREVDERHIPKMEISLAEIRSALCKEEDRQTQKQAFINLAVLYPELKRFLDHPSRWQKEYYRKLFAAVSVGVVCLKSCSKSK